MNNTRHFIPLMLSATACITIILGPHLPPLENASLVHMIPNGGEDISKNASPTNDPYLIASIIMGLLGNIILFLAYAINLRPKPSLTEGMHVFLTSAAIPAGIKLCIHTFDTAIVALSSIERLYIFIGGLALIWVSVDAVYTLIRKK